MACTKSELDLFSTKHTQTSIEKGRWTQFYPLSSLDSGPIEFNIPGLGEDYTDLQHSQIFIKAKILKTDGTNLDDAADVAPCNLFLHTLFSQVDMYLNDKLVSESNNLYSYRAYLETLLNYGEDAQKSRLSSSLWYKDSAGYMEIIGATNGGAEKRKQLIQGSSEIDMLGSLHLDLAFQEKLIPNGVNIKLRLIRNKASFALMSPTITDCMIKITHASLFVRKTTLSPPCLMAHAKICQKTPMKIPFNRCVMKMHTLAAGSHTAAVNNIVIGTLPVRLIMGLVDNDSYNGSFMKNPFNFKHYDLNCLSAYIDTEQYPSKPLEPDFANNLYIRSYMSVFNGLGNFFRDDGININRHEYSKGYTLYAFDLTPDLNEGGHLTPKKDGSLRVELKFKTPLPHTVNVLFYLEFENELQITSDRQVLTDY